MQERGAFLIDGMSYLVIKLQWNFDFKCLSSIIIVVLFIVYLLDQDKGIGSHWNPGYGLTSFAFLFCWEMLIYMDLGSQSDYVWINISGGGWIPLLSSPGYVFPPRDALRFPCTAIRNRENHRIP